MGAVLASCQGFGPAPPEVLDRLASTAAASAAPERRTATVELDSRWMSGRFHGVVVSAGGAGGAFRAQLLPEVGTKVLDLVVTPELVSGTFPQADIQVEHARRDGFRLKRSFMAFLAASLAEDLAPLGPDRVRGARLVDADFGIWELDLEPAMEGTRVWARIGPGGELVERRYRLDGIGWTERWRPVHEFRSRHFAWRLIDEVREEIERPPEALFVPAKLAERVP